MDYGLFPIEWRTVWVVCWLVFVVALAGYFILAAYLYWRDVKRFR